jgi:D-alanine-D-alanine ligase
MSERIRLAVLMGGRSSEHEVSLVSGSSVAKALDPDRFEVMPVLISRDGEWSLDGTPVALVPGSGATGVLASLDGGPSRLVDVVFPALHGPFGEDGTVQGLCEIAGVAYVGGGVGASAIAMDKALFKSVAHTHDIPVVESTVVTAAEWRDAPDDARRRIEDQLVYPLFVKPARLGSSVGISKVDGAEELEGAIELALRHDPKVLVERGMRGREVEVGVLGNDDLLISPVGEISYDSEWYDYDTKYLPDRMRLTVPADLPDATAERLQDVARRAFTAIGCAGMARVDFFVEDGGEVFLLEVNTIPGFTPTSVYAKLFEAAGIAYRDLVERLVHLGIAAAAERSRYIG